MINLISVGTTRARKLDHMKKNCSHSENALKLAVCLLPALLLGFSAAAKPPLVSKWEPVDRARQASVLSLRR